MIIYNVTLKVEAEVAAAFAAWMKREHMPDVMNTGLFTDCRLCLLLEQDETEGVTYVAQYHCDSMEHYNNYIDNFAETMREKAFKMYGGKFVAFRTVMEIV